MRDVKAALAALVALAVSAAGCSLAPKYERPAAPVAAAFVGGAAVPGGGAGAGGAGGAAAAELGWRDVFGDPRLAALVELALRNNRDLRVATLNVELLRAAYQIQRADLFPTVAATGAAEYSGNRDGVSSLYRVGVGVSAYEIDLFGRVRSLGAAALEDYLATVEARRSAHLALVAEIAEQYLAGRAADEQLALAEQTLEVVGKAVEVTRHLVEAGQRSDLDAATAEAQLARARAAAAQARRQRAQSDNALALLIGQPLPAGLPPPVSLEATALRTELPAGLPSELLQRRPDILAAEHTLKAANWEIGAARAAFYPSISLTGFAGLASTALTSLFSGGALGWSFSPQVRMPLFTGGRSRANLEAAQVRKRIEIARYEKAIQVAFREVSDALVARAAFEEQLAALIARAAAEQRRYEISETRYRNGIESYLAVLLAQQDLFAAQQQLIDLRLARLVNIVGLYKALGGGWR
ncbi:MAG TPA: efflux transporter outer membrane subunit [Kofleriaceae bacterium]|nr:efflux transporter outer membrane subunit [Kofleriaceae bacterium]